MGVLQCHCCYSATVLLLLLVTQPHATAPLLLLLVLVNQPHATAPLLLLLLLSNSHPAPTRPPHPPHHVLQEHLGVALALKVPVFFVITKVDICPDHILKQTVQVCGVGWGGGVPVRPTAASAGVCGWVGGGGGQHGVYGQQLRMQVDVGGGDRMACMTNCCGCVFTVLAFCAALNGGGVVRATA